MWFRMRTGEFMGKRSRYRNVHFVSLDRFSKEHAARIRNTFSSTRISIGDRTCAGWENETP